jgi:hypothetical protein
MNKNFVIAFLSKDKDIILEPLAEFDGTTIYFKNEIDARQYINNLYISSGYTDQEYIPKDDGLTIIRVQ